MSRATQFLLICVLCICNVLCDTYVESELNEVEHQLDDVKREVQPGCGNKPADIMFVLDESSSIWGPDFEKQLYFVTSLSRVFDVRPSVTRIGVLTFSSKLRPRFGFGDKPTYADVAAAVKGIKQGLGNTHTFDALKRVRTVTFAHPRKGAAHIAIVITDGVSDDITKTKREAALLKAKGITVFAIGVGYKINKEELTAIASSPTKIYFKKVNDYGALESLKKILAVQACKVTTESPPPTTTTTPKPTTTKPQMIEDCKGRREVDVVFAMPDQLGVQETSDSVDFIKAVAKETHISPKQAQMGVCGQQCHARPEIYLRDNTNKDQLLGALEKLRLSGTPTHKVLFHMRTTSFGPTNGVRRKAVKFGILIINNKSTNLQKTMVEAAKAKKGLELITIGVGKRIDHAEVGNIATSKKNTFFVRDYESLIRLKAAIVDRICQGIQSAAFLQGVL